MTQKSDADLVALTREGDKAAFGYLIERHQTGLKLSLLEEIRVEHLKDDVFYAVVKLNSGGTVKEVDARPSDAINLALRTGCPI